MKTKNYHKNIIMNVATAIAVGASAMTIGVAINALFDKTTKPKELSVSLTTELAELENQISKNELAILDIKYQIQEISKLDDTTEIGIQLSSMRSEINLVVSRINDLEDGLLENPQKALLVPLLRNDLQNLEQAYRADIEAMAKSIDRVYDQNKWFISLMFTMAIGIIGLAISNFVQSKTKFENK